ncbi:protein SHQ1 homolog isoform X2 [Alosa pseudoharengus]|uniref:protein SHQ1 homolog isoform X2 n=1 Tax=Alosa pseudoharengus TaxID=34774 RepID=UPI003F8AE2A4
MLTPAFELSQDSDFLTLMIRVPYTRTSEFDLCIDGDDFKFYAKPYFLRLTLPGRIVEDGREKASFNIDKGAFTLRVPKETPGQHFEGLQMLTSLLAPKGTRSAKPLVEDMEPCVGSAGAGLEVEEEEEDEEDEEEFDWQVEQAVYTECSEEELNQLQKYGFGNLRCGVFTRLQEELSDVVDVKDPDRTTPAARRSGRQAAEHNKFDPDHYLADLFEDEAIQSLLRFGPWWGEASSEQSQHSPASIEFSDEDKEQMRKFTNRSYLLDKSTRQHVWLSLLDIVLAYAYEIRVTEGEHSTYHSLQDVLVSFGRRVVSYPLYRHFSLVTAAVRDAARIFQAGKACVLKCLLDVHKIFRENDPAYILNDLYITDYCVWIQKVKSKHVSSLTEPLQKATLKKKDLGLDLEELEAAAALVEEEEEEEDEEEEEGSSSGEESGSSESSDSSSDSSSSSSSEDSDDRQTHEEPRAPCVLVNSGSVAGEKENNRSSSSSSRLQQPQPAAPVEDPALTPSPAPGLPPRGAADGAARTTSSTTSSSSTSSSSPAQLIQELGERLGEGLQISPARPEGTPPPSSSFSSSSSSSCVSSVEQRERQRMRAGEGESARGSQPVHTRPPCSEQRHAPPAEAANAERTLPTARPHRKPLVIVKAEELDSDDDEDCLPGH